MVTCYHQWCGTEAGAPTCLQGTEKDIGYVECAECRLCGEELKNLVDVILVCNKMSEEREEGRQMQKPHMENRGNNTDEFLFNNDNILVNERNMLCMKIKLTTMEKKNQ